MSGLEGTTLGHYRLKHLLGRGGMSEVYLAYDEHQHSDVAIRPSMLSGFNVKSQP